jgi:hypothetical protein
MSGAHETALINSLRRSGFDLLHSPQKEFAQWEEWYERSCRETIERASIFIAVLSQDWTRSTWMLHEINEAGELLESGKLGRVYFWNPERLKIPELLSHLQQLPDDVDAVTNVLCEE